jgi:parvulin-like peptidyl-prolyl isomerase
MESSSFLSINDQPITISQVVKFLQTSGKLGQFISDVLRQYTIEEEIQVRTDIEINPTLTEQKIIDFRLKNQLTEPEKFQEWLNNSGSDYITFHASVTANFKAEKLKLSIAEPQLTEHFIERKLFLDRVVLSRIVVNTKELAEEIQTQIEEGSSFEQLAREYSLTDERVFNGMMGPISRGTMPDILRSVVDTAAPGQLIGPIELEGRFGLFRVEHFLPASLDDVQLKQTLINELFEKWLAEKIQKLTVKLQVS